MAGTGLMDSSHLALCGLAINCTVSNLSTFTGPVQSIDQVDKNVQILDVEPVAFGNCFAATWNRCPHRGSDGLWSSLVEDVQDSQ